MARVLIVGCGGRGQALARELVAAGHAVRGTTRDPARVGAIAAAGAEPYVGDPDRIATLMEAIAGVTVVAWLLGSAEGDARRGAARGAAADAVREARRHAGARAASTRARARCPDEVLAGGAEIVRAAAATWNIPVEVLATDRRGLRGVDAATPPPRSRGCSLMSMDRATLSAITHRGVAFANPLPRRRSTRRSPRCRCRRRARARRRLRRGRAAARIKARHGARTEGIEPAAEWAAARARARRRRGARGAVRRGHARARRLRPRLLPRLLARDRGLGRRARAAWRRWRAADGGLGLVGEGFWRREPSAGYLERARRRERGRAAGGLEGLEAGARGAGWEVRASAVASDADWAAYEETLLANGEAELAARPIPTCAPGSRRRGRAGRARAGRTRWASRC